MAFETGAATDIADMITKLFTFATANGWTQDDLDTPNGEASFHNTSGRCFISFRWNTSTPNNLAIYNALGFGIGVSVAVVGTSGGTGYAVGDVLTVAGGTKTTAATLEVLTLGASNAVATVRVLTCGVNYTVNPTLTDNAVTGGGGSSAVIDLTMGGTDTTPGNGCDDSGQGFVTSTDAGSSGLEVSRGITALGDAAHTYYFFEDSTPDVLYIVLVSSAGVHRHVHLGEADKKGDWIGGEFCCGHNHNSSGITDTNNCVAMDGVFVQTTGNRQHRGPTIHMESVIDQASAGKWGAVFNSDSSDADAPGPGGQADREGNERQLILGGFKANLIGSHLGWVASNASNGYVPFYSLAFWYWDKVPTADEVALLGFMPNVRGTSMRGFTPAQELTVGSETWVVFPVSRKANTGDADDSLNLGLAYLKVV